MDGLVSIIIPVYNTGMIIKRCINSILNSEYKNIEIIIVDDGSDNETATICDDFKNEEKIYVIHQKNAGVSSARNKGIEWAQGEFITFVDADDTIDSKLISVLVSDCRKTNADISICGYKEWESNKHFLEVCSKETEVILNNKEILKKFFSTNDIGWSVWGKLYKKDLIGDTRFILGKRNAEDMYFVYEVLKKANVLTINNRSLYNYEKQENSAMTDSNCEKFFDTYELINKVFEDDLNNELKNEQFNFYVKSELWFLRFINAKDKNNKFHQEIQEAKIKFIKKIQGKDNECSRKIKMELKMLQYCYPIFRLTSLIWGYKKGI